VDSLITAIRGIDISYMAEVNEGPNHQG